MDSDFLKKIMARSTVKPYTGPVVEIGKADQPPIVTSPPEVCNYNEKNVTLTYRSADERICQGETFGVLCPMSAYREGDTWKVKMNYRNPAGLVKVRPGMEQLELLEEPEYFRETEDGVYALKNSQEYFSITNIRLRVQARIKRYWEEDSEPVEELKCLLYSKEWSTPKTITVPLSEYKNVYSSIIKNRFPELFLSSKARDYLEKYLSSVYSRCQSNLKEEIHIMKIGWTAIGGNIRYVIGEDPVYKKFYLPDVSLMDKGSVFREGFRFLKIGRFRFVSLIPFLFAHFSYAAFLFNKAQRTFQSTLFLRGETNTYKTRISEVFCNIFQTDNEKKKLSFGTTIPALYKTMSILRDQTILLDDFSCSEKNKKRNDTALLEAAIRAIGDSNSPAKTSVSKEGGVDNRSFRATLVVTGEDNPPLSNSSYYRMIIVPVDKQSYDNGVLQEFQHKPSIMRNYMALFIEFLRDNGDQIVKDILPKAQEYEDRYGRDFKIARVRYATVNLLIMGDMIRQFARWCSIFDPGILNYMAGFDKIVVEAMLDNQEETSGLEPEVMFLYALRQIIGTRENLRLAKSEAEYIANESGFTGFREVNTDTIWLRHEDAEQAVRYYWDKQQKAYTVTSPKLHRILCEKGIARGSKLQSGKAEYLLKAKKGSRKRMLVLNYKTVCEILDSVKD